MSQTLAPSLHSTQVPIDDRTSSGPPKLADIAVGDSAEVKGLLLDHDTAAWLRAVGIGEGEMLTVLRRAAFGGPIHVRTGSGGEFALHKSLAASVVIRPRSMRG